MSEDARRQISAELLQYLEFVWDLHFIGTRAWELEGNEEVFRMIELGAGSYACEYSPGPGLLWNFELDAAGLREIMRAGVREIEVRERADDRGQYIGNRQGAAQFLRDLVEADELELEADPSDEDAFEALVDALSEELSFWMSDMRSLTEVSEQRQAVAEFVDWLLELPGVEDLYMPDLDLYWLLRRRLWDLSEGADEAGGLDVAGLMAMLSEGAPGKATDAPGQDASGEGPDLGLELAMEMGFEDEFSAEQPLASARHDAAKAAGVKLEFPLFAADMEEAGSYVGPGFCIVRQVEAEHVFELGIGDYVRCICANCKTENYLDAADAEDVACVSCSKPVPFPPFPGEEVTASYEALRSGDVAMIKDTEFGMIGPEQAAAGLTHGEPELESDQVEIVELEDGWRAARLDPADMWELLRTPTYVSWQGEVWLFNAGKPMVFLGSWSREQFNARAEDGNGKALFEKIVEDLPPFDIWERFEPGSELCVYVFECATTGILRASWDMA